MKKVRSGIGSIVYRIMSFTIFVLYFMFFGSIQLASLSNGSVVASSLPAAESVEFMSLFKNNMVVQSGKPVKVWGTYTGEATGVSIEVTFGSETKTADAQNGKWSVLFTARSVNKTGQSITVNSGIVSKSISGVLVGDVWLASGQSNMALTVDYFSKANSGVASDYRNISDNDMVRVFNVPKVASGSTPATEFFSPGSTSWQSATAFSVTNFSAYGYAFAYHLQKGADVPVGLIDASYSGTRIEYWLTTGGCHNQMVNPLKGISIKGVIWYQGESNVQDYMIPNYTTSFSLYAGLIRTVFNDQDLPIITTQLPRFMDANFSLWPYFRVKQWETAQAVSDTYMACAVDMGIPPDNIHPYDKIPLAKRAAELALNVVYGREDMPGESPYPTEVSVSGNKVILKFANAQSGLEIRGDSIKELYLTDVDGKKAAAQAILTGNIVELTAPGVDNPFSVLYAITNIPDVNFYAKNGLPVIPFLFKDLDDLTSQISSVPASSSASSSSSVSSIVPASSIIISSTFSTISSGNENSVELSDPGSTDEISVSDISEDPESIGLSEESNISSDASSAPSETSDAESSDIPDPKGKASAGSIAGIIAASAAVIAGIFYGVRRFATKRK